MLLSKHHGLGNDFLVVLDERNGRPVPAGPDDARRLCDRRRGIGADGLIHGATPTDEQAAQRRSTWSCGCSTPTAAGPR